MGLLRRVRVLTLAVTVIPTLRLYPIRLRSYLSPAYSTFSGLLNNPIIFKSLLLSQRFVVLASLYKTAPGPLFSCSTIQVSVFAIVPFRGPVTSGVNEAGQPCHNGCPPPSWALPLEVAPPSPAIALLLYLMLLEMVHCGVRIFLRAPKMQLIG